MVPETDGVKLMKGFIIQSGRKRTDMEQMSMREHPISDDDVTVLRLADQK